MIHGRFNENLYLDRDLSEIWWSFKYQSSLSNINVLELSLNFGYRKYEQKCMSRRSQVFAICDSQMCLRMPQILKFSYRMHLRLEVRSPRAIFFRSCVKFNASSARASWAWALAPRFSFTCCVADDLSGLLNDAQRLVTTCWMLHWLVTISCHNAAAEAPIGKMFF